MDEFREDRDALAAAGYTGFRGAVAFAVIMTVIGALFGSVVFALIVGALVPELSETVQVGVGTVLGALIGVSLAVLKVRRGNLEALEHLEDKEWRRYMRRHHGK
ncbi:hypothetical protein [Hyphomicrobium nitrativorans]|nr:hypothetical protein [Hyphomicrobium nitrativorans]